MSTQGIGTDLGVMTASADLSAKQFCAVVVSGNFTVAAGGANASMIGVLQNKPANGQSASVRVAGVTKAVAGAAVSAGADLMTDANGNFITATSTNLIVGKALEAAGALGVVFAMLIKSNAAKP